MKNDRRANEAPPKRFQVYAQRGGVRVYVGIYATKRAARAARKKYEAAEATTAAEAVRLAPPIAVVVKRTRSDDSWRLNRIANILRAIIRTSETKPEGGSDAKR